MTIIVKEIKTLNPSVSKLKVEIFKGDDDEGKTKEFFFSSRESFETALGMIKWVAENSDIKFFEDDPYDPNALVKGMIA